MGQYKPWPRSQKKVLDSTKWHWPAEMEPVLVTSGNGILFPSPRAQTLPLFTVGMTLALLTENGEERTREKSTVLVEITEVQPEASASGNLGTSPVCLHGAWSFVRKEAWQGRCHFKELF